MCLGLPGKIIDVYMSGEFRMCRVDFDGVIREVCLEAIAGANVGDYVIVHAGFALALVSESEAEITLETLKDLVNFGGEEK